MSSLICGSIAYDTIMSFEGRFQDQILADQIHILNVAFLVPSMRREFGGCAGNIAYNLKLLGGDPIIMATVGGDAGSYYDQLAKHGISADHIREIPDAFTAQAMITTDRDNNQITAFHPGAMGESHLNTVANVIKHRDEKKLTKPHIAIVAPDGRQGMIEHCQQLANTNIPFIFDPGQGLPMFDGKDLLDFIDQATYIAVNDYEGEMLSQRTGLTFSQISEQVEALIVTKGAQGAEIYTQNRKIDIPPVPVEKAIDPTGCGDAFRGGLLFGLEQKFDWETTGRLASLMGSLKIESQGPQNHQASQETIKALFKKAFNYSF
jgi:adenosine kinase